LLTSNSGEVSVPCGASPSGSKVLIRPLPRKPATGCWPGAAPFEGPAANAPALVFLPLLSPLSGTYQQVLRRIVRDAPGLSSNGTASEAPGARSGTGGLLTARPSATLFHASVSGSHHPPRNQQWSTAAPGSSTKQAKAPLWPRDSPVPA
jgi:hypothetical protein